MNYTLLFAILLLSKCTPETMPSQPTTSDAISIFDFSATTPPDSWFVQDDVVMGGRSDGNIETTDAGYGRFYGEVSLENNGGFSSIRYNPEAPVEVDGKEKFILRLRGDGSKYTIRVNDDPDKRYYYQYTFPTTGEWQEIEVPFADMEPVFRGRSLDLPNYAGGPVTRVQFLIGNKRAQTFEVLLDWMRAV